MNVIVVPDAAMIVIPLIEKNGHSYLSPSDFSKYDNMDICEGNLTYDNLICLPQTFPNMTIWTFVRVI